MIKKLSYVASAIFKRGIGFLFTYFKESVWFDIRHGTKTSSRVPKDEQDITSASDEENNGLLYVASFTSVTEKSVEIARKILGDERFMRAQFFDLGCGKGKAILVYVLKYVKRGYPKAIGIEYDGALVKIANENVKQCGLGSDVVQVVEDSATNIRSYTGTAELIIYLYNSFQGETLKTVLRELSGVPHVLIYIDPAEKNILAEFGYELHHEVIGKYHADTWLVSSKNILKYESNA